MKKPIIPLVFPFRGLGRFLFGLSLLLMLATACRREPPEPPAPKSDLPAETQTGANTFGCYINGAPWTPVSNQWSIPKLSMEYDIDKVFNLSAVRLTSSERNAMSISSMSVNGVGNYTLAKGSNGYASFENKGEDLSTHDQDVIGSGTLTITRFDVQNGIISGRFEFTLKKEGQPEVKVTAGRFDCKM